MEYSSCQTNIQYNGNISFTNLFSLFLSKFKSYLSITFGGKAQNGVESVDGLGCIGKVNSTLTLFAIFNETRINIYIYTKGYNI